MQDNATQTNIPAAPQGVTPYKTGAFEEYVTFCALGGVLVDEVGKPESMTLYQFCQRVGVDRATTWRWKKNTPNFGELVRKRRDEIFPWARETALWNRLYLIATSSMPTRVTPVVNPKTGRTYIVRSGALHDDQRAAVDAAKLLLGNSGDLKLPTQRQEVDIKHSVSDLLRAAREDGIIEGEVVNGGADNATANGEDAGILPLPS